MNIFEAIEQGDFDQVRFCLEAGEDINQISKGEITPLMQACCTGNIDMVRMLIEDYSADVNFVNAKGYSPLLWICLFGDIDIACLLIDLGADVNKSSIDNITPLIMAVRLNHIDLTELLIESGADLDFYDPFGKKAYDIALEKEYYDVMELLHPAEFNNPEDKDFFDYTVEYLGKYLVSLYGLL